ncbi:MAG: hypothetical protein V3T70_10835, partial [Phycisphaerae bacterium]
MIQPSAYALLAQLPEAGFYFHPVKLSVFAAALALWWYTWAWTDKDAVKVRSNPAQWTMFIGAGGMLGMALWLLMPTWWVGLLLYGLSFGGTSLAYVIYRNGRVSPTRTILTPSHLQRLISRKPMDAEALGAQDKVRIKDAEGKTPKWPTDSAQHDAYTVLQDLLFDAIWRRASNVEINVAGQQARIFYKVDGVVRERDPIERPQADVVLGHLKRISGLNPEEMRRPQEGRFGAKIGAGGTGDRAVDVLVKSFGSTTGHRVQLKVVSDEAKLRINEL